MKKTNKLLMTAMAFIAIVTLSLLFVGCEPEIEYRDRDVEVPVYIPAVYAFGKVIPITNNSSATEADFNTAMGNLNVALVYADENMSDSVRNRLTVGLGHGITIVSGNNTISADTNNFAIITGIDFLIAGDKNTIAGALNVVGANPGAFGVP